MNKKMHFITGFVRTPQDLDESEFRRQSLRDCTVCLGCLKLMSFLCSMILFFLVLMISYRDGWSSVLMALIIISAFLRLCLGALLIIGATYEDITMLTVALGLCLLLALWDSVTGVFGFFYFIRNGSYTAQFILAIIFGFLVFSICEIICHDAIVIFSLIVSINPDSERSPPSLWAQYVYGANKFSTNSPMFQQGVCLKASYNPSPPARTDLIRTILHEDSSESCPSTKIATIECHTGQVATTNNETHLNPTEIPGVLENNFKISTSDNAKDISSPSLTVFDTKTDSVSNTLTKEIRICEDSVKSTSKPLLQSDDQKTNSGVPHSVSYKTISESTKLASDRKT